MKITLGSYQITGHRPGEPLKEGERGFINFPMKIAKAAASVNRARPANGPVTPAAPVSEREVASAQFVTKTVISVRKDTPTLNSTQNFAVKQAQDKPFSISPFIARRGITAQSFNGGSIVLTPQGRQDLFKSTELQSNSAAEETFRAEMAKFVLDARALLRDPQAVAVGLKPLNDELGARMGWSEADYPGVDTLVVGDNTLMLPNYANIQPLPEKKEHVLSQVLHENEAAHGINVENGAAPMGDVPLFDGFIQPEIANRFIGDGHLFGENENRSGFIMHGTYSHRLQWECLRRWIESGRLQLPSAIAPNGVPDADSFRKLLAASVYVETKPGLSSSVSLWTKLVDSADDVPSNNDSRDTSDFRVVPKRQGMSCLAPNLMMSTIKCFGDSLGLKHLQKYLNDSAVKRLRNLAVIDRSDATFQKASEVEVGDLQVFKRLAFLLNGDKPPGLTDLPFTLPDEEKPDEEAAMYQALEPGRLQKAKEFVQQQTQKYAERGPTAGRWTQPVASSSGGLGAGPSTQPSVATSRSENGDP